MADTQDIVQDALLDTFRNFDSFEVRGEGALLAYLRRSVLNRIINESRRVKRRGIPASLDPDRPDDAPSPVEQAIGRDRLARYERALGTLRPRDREAIIGRIEMGCSYDELANSLHFPSPAAARKAVERAVRRLAEAMADGK
jgi:RNA polymerase sigma-70 factor (ECF subfamily)